MITEAGHLAARAKVDAWIDRELEAAMTATEYGRAIQACWRSISPDIGNQLAHAFRQIPGGDSTHNRILIDALQNGEADSYYKALFHQALALVQAADRDERGEALENIRIAFLPSNSRYAAIFEPAVAPGWLVIGFDWGVLCAVMTLAGVVSNCVQGGFTGDGAMDWRLIPEGAVQHFDAHPELQTLLIEGLAPSLLPSMPPIAPTFGAAVHQMVFGLMVMKAMVFGLVAHEYAHARHAHFRDPRLKSELRSQLEHEADATAILFALKDPWALIAKHQAAYNPQERTFTVAGCLLLQCLLKQLQMGDCMVRDLTGTPGRQETHPDPADRMKGLRQVIDLLLPTNTVQRREVEKYAWFLINLADAIWNRSIEPMIDYLRQREELEILALANVPDAELRLF
jgi:hypothetical protein